jgi:predicted unusual protein kinase regulating ubiquinone biosynthesis (AarF/ABC1/UbiB family)
MAKHETRTDIDRTPPVGKMARTAVVGVTAAKVGAKTLGLLSKRPFLSEASFQQHQARHDEETADVLFQGISKLRGSALKVAQMMSMEMGVLPDAYRREFSKSHYQVPPLNRAVVRRLLISEFGKPPEDVFHTFDTTAFAAASLGQVHHARTHAGERVAVKVQYPGIGSALQHDMQMVRQFARPFFRAEYTARILQEIEQRFLEEIDYDRERKNTAWFSQQTQMPGIVIPRPFDAYSSPLVLTTEFVDGVHLDRWRTTNPSQAQRDRAAQRMYDFFMHSLFERHTMHADPNPGNYLFRDDGTVAVIDFGSVKVFTPALCDQMMAMWRAHLHDDRDTIVSLYCDFGLANGDRDRVRACCATTLAPFGAWMRLPYAEDVFDFGKHSNFCTQGATLFRDMLAYRDMDGFTTETVIFDRNLYGLFRMFTEMKARVHMKNQWIY